MRSVKELAARVRVQVERARAKFAAMDILVQTFKRHSEDDGGFYAASLTYYTFFSIFPLLLFATAALGYVVRDPETRAELIEAGKGTFPLISEVLRPRSLANIEQRRGVLALVGLALGLYSGSGAVAALQHALNRIYRIPDRKSAVARRVRAIRWLAMFGTIALISVVLAGIGALLPGPLKSVLAYAGSLTVSFLLFTTAFRFLPNRERCPWGEVVPGAIVAAVVFESLKLVGSLYLHTGEQGRESTFGVVFAAAAALLVASYILCQVTLLAAEFNAVIAERRITRDFSLADMDEQGL